MNWLITGGCGFIGRALIARLLQDPAHRIRVLDNLSVGTAKDLAAVTAFAPMPHSADWADWDAPVQLAEGDILDPDMMQRVTTGADVVIHLAANTGVAPSVEDPMADARTNVFGVLNTLEACRANGVGRFVFASSGAPLGVQTPPLNEEMAPHPASPYGASKLAGEGYCSAYYHCFGVETVALRFGNVYGEGSAHKASVVAKFIKQAYAGETLEIYGDGSQTRDFVYIGDLIDAVVLAATRQGVGGEVFQIATAAETTLAELAETLLNALEDETGIKAKVVNGAERTGDVQRNFSDTTKAGQRLGWSAKVPLDEGLRRTVRWFAGNQKGIGA